MPGRLGAGYPAQVGLVQGWNSRTFLDSLRQEQSEQSTQTPFRFRLASPLSLLCKRSLTLETRLAILGPPFEA